MVKTQKLVSVNIRTQARDLPELLEWLAKMLRNHPKDVFDVTLVLNIVKDC